MDWHEIERLVNIALKKDYDSEEAAQKNADLLNSFEPPWSCPLVKDNCAGNGLHAGPDRLPVKRCVCFAPARVGKYNISRTSDKWKIYGYACTSFQLFGPEGL